MKVDRAFLMATATSLGARPDMVEKVIQLLGLLNNLMASRISRQPWLLWKAQNVLEHKKV